MKHWKIRTKIQVGFSVVIVIGLILGAVGFISTRMLTNMTNELSAVQESGNTVNTILNAHYIWRQGITETGYARREFTGSLDPNACALGKWKNSDAAKSITDPALLALIEQIDEPHSLIHTEAAAVVENVQEGNMEGASAQLDIILPETQEVITGLTAMQERFAELAEEKSMEITALGNALIITIAALVCASLAAGAVLAVYIAGLISKPIIPFTAYLKKAGTTGDITLSPGDTKQIGEYGKRRDEIGQMITAFAAFLARISEIEHILSDVADGDLTAKLALLSEEDSMGRSLRGMLQNLQDMLSEINASSSQVNAGSNQLAHGAQALAAGSTEQAASIQELSAALSEIAEKTKDNADKAEKASRLADSIKAVAGKGNAQMDGMIQSVKEINEASQSIGKVIKTIDDIAFQTNILALNAAVEAARAGQHGKGFAVVAEEVRNLAQKSAEAAKDTENLIANSMEKADKGVQIANETAQSLSEIVSGINESSMLVGEIAAASEAQSAGLTRINSGIDQVAQVVQQNSATAEESAAASEEMSGQSAMLQELISQFKLDDDDIAARIVAHAPKKLLPASE